MIEQIIFRQWQTFQEFNQTSAQGLLTYPAHIWGGFIPLLLFAIFTITLLTTYFSKKRTTGEGNFKGSFAVAGFFVGVVAILMNLIPDLINSLTTAIAVGIAILGVVILFIPND